MDVLFSGWAIQIICVVQWELLVVQIELNQFAAGPAQLNHGLLRIPDNYDAKIAKFCYLWTFWPVIQLKKHIFCPIF